MAESPGGASLPGLFAAEAAGATSAILASSVEMQISGLITAG
jgi:hypothetical protein